MDAPVSGGDVGARNAALSFMIGGDAPTVAALRPLFDAMGKNVRFMGGAGKGQHTKMVGGWVGWLWGNGSRSRSFVGFLLFGDGWTSCQAAGRG